MNDTTLTNWSSLNATANKECLVSKTSPTTKPKLHTTIAGNERESDRRRLLCATLRRRRVSHVHHPLLRHLPAVRRAQRLQELPLLLVEGPPVHQRLRGDHRDPLDDHAGLQSGHQHAETRSAPRIQAHPSEQRLDSSSVQREPGLLHLPRDTSGAPWDDPHIHGPADYQRDREQEGAQAEEGLRLPLGPVHSGDFDTDMFRDGPTMVCGCDGSVDQPREFAEAGVGVRGSRGEAPVLGREGAAGDAHTDLPHDRVVRVFDADVGPHSHACLVRGVLVHGSRFAEGAAVLRQDPHHVHAQQVPT